jgi:type II secretory pathway component PulF
MVKVLATLTARVVSSHRELSPLISRIHSGFMVERSIQAAEEELKNMQEMLRQVRETLKAPKPNSQDYTLLK